MKMYNGNNQNNWSKSRNDQKNSYSQERETPAIKHEVLTKDNYSDLAESIFKGKNGDGDLITKSKIRNLLAMAIEIYYALPQKNVGEKVELEDILDRINYFKIRCYYEASREKKVEGFLKDANIFEYLEGLSKRPDGDVDKAMKRLEQEFILFVRYMEALVAFRAYYIEKK